MVVGRVAGRHADGHRPGAGAVSRRDGGRKGTDGDDEIGRSVQGAHAVAHEGLEAGIVQNRPEVERDYDAFVPKLFESMNARMNELLDTVAAIYARNFTAAELNEIIAFYRGPTGQKFVQRQGGILQESMAAGQKFGQELGGELQRRMTDELRRMGHNI
jgi:hypothetical protein